MKSVKIQILSIILVRKSNLRIVRVVFDKIEKIELRSLRKLQKADKMLHIIQMNRTLTLDLTISPSAISGIRHSCHEDTIYHES